MSRSPGAKVKRKMLPEEMLEKRICPRMLNSLGIDAKPVHSITIKPYYNLSKQVKPGHVGSAVPGEAETEATDRP